MYARVCCACLMIACAVTACAAAPPEVPHIDSVVMMHPQPQEAAPEVIWYDDFDGQPRQYTEAEGPVVSEQAFGGSGQSMLLAL